MDNEAYFEDFSFASETLWELILTGRIFDDLQMAKDFSGGPEWVIIKGESTPLISKTENIE